MESDPREIGHFRRPIPYTPTHEITFNGRELVPYERGL